MIERVNSAIEHLKNIREVLSCAEFATKIGLKPSQISEMLNRKRVISEKTIHKIAVSFPVLNEHWLLTGEGEMLKTNPQQSKNRTELDTAERLLFIVESQQRTIEELSKKIK